ncbi:MAG: signal peptidase I [Chromatiales bacterium]|jgi:signal peptidase I
MTSPTTGSWNDPTSVSSDIDVRPRKPVLALLLSVCPGLGQQYAGNLLRGIILYISLVIFSWLAAIAYMYVESPVLGLLLLSVPFVGVALIAIDAFYCAKRQPQDYRLKWYNRFWIYSAVFILLMVTVNPLMDYLVGGHIVRALFVTSDSMRPAVLNRDLVVINKLEKPNRGDIVLIKFADDRSDTEAQEEKPVYAKKRPRSGVTKLMKDDVLRRVIAQAGDTVEIKGRQVYLNGEPLQEDYASYSAQHSLNPYTASEYHLEPIFVPSGSYFVLSDAREFSFDSRIFGFVEAEEINGVATKVFWSWNLDQGHFLWNRTAMSLK